DRGGAPIGTVHHGVDQIHELILAVTYAALRRMVRKRSLDKRYGREGAGRRIGLELLERNDVRPQRRVVPDLGDGVEGEMGERDAVGICVRLPAHPELT